MIANYIIIHDPHSSSVLTEDHEIVIDPMPEIALVTDWHVGDLIKGDDTISFAFSRVCCDVERFAFDPEAELRGQGVVYTRTIDGRTLREHPSAEMLSRVRSLYDAHHSRLIEAIERSCRNGPLIVVDAHSFSDQQARLTGVDGNGPMPDICLGYNEGSPPQFIDLLSAYFSERGLSVAYNMPFAGTMLPAHFTGNPLVSSVMIEVHKRLYLQNQERSNRHEEGYVRLRQIMDGAITVLRRADLK